MRLRPLLSSIRSSRQIRTTRRRFCSWVRLIFGTGNAQQVVASMLDLLEEAARSGSRPRSFWPRPTSPWGGWTMPLRSFASRSSSPLKDPQPYLLLGLILRQQNKIDEARKAFENAQRLAPENLLAVTQLVDLDHRRAGTLMPHFNVFRRSSRRHRSRRLHISWKAKSMRLRVSGIALRLRFSKRLNWIPILQALMTC